MPSSVTVKISAEVSRGVLATGHVERRREARDTVEVHLLHRRGADKNARTDVGHRNRVVIAVPQTIVIERNPVTGWCRLCLKKESRQDVRPSVLALTAPRSPIGTSSPTVESRRV